ncbi:hypothetical protein B0H34DRAFT_808881 [Crassisporium funariophilum]|nr:hypothetical protein B0H34DRAFT_808881 [Crassisporium funariophilum]
MLLISVAVLFSLLIPVAVLSAPIEASSSYILYARAIAVLVSPAPEGDYESLVTRPLNPAALPAGCTKEHKKIHAKAVKNCATWNTRHANFMGVVAVRITAAIHAAESQLKLAGPLTVTVTTALHTSRSDLLEHYTFYFSAPVCGDKPCTGHAYKAGAAKQARIFSSSHVVLYDA